MCRLSIRARLLPHKPQSCKPTSSRMLCMWKPFTRRQQLSPWSPSLLKHIHLTNPMNGVMNSPSFPFCLSIPTWSNQSRKVLWQVSPQFPQRSPHLILPQSNLIMIHLFLLFLKNSLLNVTLAPFLVHQLNPLSVLFKLHPYHWYPKTHQTLGVLFRIFLFPFTITSPTQKFIRSTILLMLTIFRVLGEYSILFLYLFSLYLQTPVLAFAMWWKHTELYLYIHLNGLAPLCVLEKILLLSTRPHALASLLLEASGALWRMHWQIFCVRMGLDLYRSGSMTSYFSASPGNTYPSTTRSADFGKPAFQMLEGSSKSVLGFTILAPLFPMVAPKSLMTTCPFHSEKALAMHQWRPTTLPIQSLTLTTSRSLLAYTGLQRKIPAGHRLQRLWVSYGTSIKRQSRLLKTKGRNTGMRLHSSLTTLRSASKMCSRSMANLCTVPTLLHSDERTLQNWNPHFQHSVIILSARSTPPPQTFQ